MTYKINGIQYWKRNGICCSWTEEEGRMVISEEEYERITGKTSVSINPVKVNKSEPAPIIEEKPIDPKSKVEIAYQEVDKNDRIRNKKKVVTYGNLEKVLTNLESKENFIKILATRYGVL